MNAHPRRDKNKPRFAFVRSNLPQPLAYYLNIAQVKLAGHGEWRTALCPFHHDKHPSLRINIKSGGFRCMACDARGGDILAFHQLKTGLSFTDAAKDLGAWLDAEHDTSTAQAIRNAQIIKADQKHRQTLEAAANEKLKAAQAFIPLIARIIKHCSTPLLPPPYCLAKGIDAHNLLSIEAPQLQCFTTPMGQTVAYGFQGTLTVAVLKTLDGQPIAIQVFDGQPGPKGKYQRRFIGRPICLNAFYQLGEMENAGVALITEGVADAISCHQATGYPVLAAMTKSQLSTAAKALHHRHPCALIVVCGDNDADGGGQRAAYEAAKAVNGLALMPMEF